MDTGLMMWTDVETNERVSLENLDCDDLILSLPLLHSTRLLMMMHLELKPMYSCDALGVTLG